MIRAQDIGSLTDFRQHAAERLDELAKTGGVRVLTVNGQARGVVMSPQVYDQLAAEAWQDEVTRKIREGMAEIEAGKGIDAHQAMRELADEFGIKLPE